MVSLIEQLWPCGGLETGTWRKIIKD
jgi:hypothetical protein